MKKYIIIFILSFSQFSSFAQDEYVDAMVVRNNQFAVDYYNIYSTSNDNIVLSPFGVSNCMAMAYIGSDGNTQKQIAESMYFITPFGVLYSFKQLIKRFQTYKSKELNLLISNSLWLSSDIDIEKKYKNLLKVNFLAHVQSLSLKNENCVKQINRWAKKKSNYNILSLVNSDIPDKDNQLIYTNFVYLNGDWENPFNDEFTGKDNFYMLDSSVRKVDFMNQIAYLKYNENELFQIIELPYSGKSISMIIILPKKVDGLDSIEKNISSVNFDFWTSELYTKQVRVSLPKFKSEFNQDVVSALKIAGSELSFEDNAEFKGITKSSIKISKIIQNTIIEVAENKSKNLTELFVDPTEKQSVNSSLIRFNANHPFIYLVKDNLNNGILLIGKMVSPNYINLSPEYNLK